MQLLDTFVIGFDHALRAITGEAMARRPTPATRVVEGDLDVTERQHSAGLMRVNHVGEVCAQALYEAQGRFSKNDNVKQQFIQ
ncbi:MAG: demethoxyubiquinone hydroxylase family protein, partial [Burkholderiaceae bacterium]